MESQYSWPILHSLCMEGHHHRWTDYCNNHEITVSDYWLSQKHRKIIGPDGLEK